MKTYYDSNYLTIWNILSISTLVYNCKLICESLCFTVSKSLSCCYLFWFNTSNSLSSYLYFLIHWFKLAFVSSNYVLVFLTLSVRDCTEKSRWLPPRFVLWSRMLVLFLGYFKLLLIVFIVLPKCRAFIDIGENY